MKKLLTVIAAFVLTFSLFTGTAQAANSIQITVDGQAVALTDAAPFVDSNNRVLVPMRALGEVLGCKVDYTNDGYMQIDLSKTIANKQQLTARFTDSALCQVFAVNGSTYDEVEMDTAPAVKNTRTYLPARYVAEAFGYTVTWNGNRNTVVITTDKTASCNQAPYAGLTEDALTGYWQLDGRSVYTNDLSVLQIKADKQVVWKSIYGSSTDADAVKTVDAAAAYAGLELKNEGSVSTFLDITFLDQDHALLREMNGSKAFTYEMTRLAGDLSAEQRAASKAYVELDSDYMTTARYYYYYDIDNNGIDELIVLNGDCEANFEFQVYTYKNGQVVDAGRFSGGHSQLYGSTKGAGLIVHYGHMGYEEVNLVTLADGKITETQTIIPHEVVEYTVPADSYLLLEYETYHTNDIW